MSKAYGREKSDWNLNKVQLKFSANSLTFFLKCLHILKDVRAGVQLTDCESSAMHV